MEHQRNDHNPIRIFVDSDAFIALAREDDTNHKETIALLHKIVSYPVQFITSNYVFSESVTVISMRKSHQAAVQFMETVKSAERAYTFLWIDEKLEKEAIDLFAQQTSKNTSFVDCTNMVCMKNMAIDAIFSFDKVYKTNGFLLAKDIDFHARKA